MFTGIVEEIGVVKDISRDRLHIEAQKVLADLKQGDSISVNGACLTVTRIDKSSFSVDLMPETIRRTSFNMLRSGQRVNLERALLANSRLGGHFVQGHVDGTGTVVSLGYESDAVLMRIEAPADLIKYIVEKGFIAVDGVSLTVVRLDNSQFTVSLVRFTREQTTLAERKPGDKVNLEVDILAKYVEKFMREGEKESILLDYLHEYGSK